MADECLSGRALSAVKVGRNGGKNMIDLSDNPNGYKWNRHECTTDKYTFTCEIYPDNYQRLLTIAHRNNIQTFDVSTIINYVIETYFSQ